MINVFSYHFCPPVLAVHFLTLGSATIKVESLGTLGSGTIRVENLAGILKMTHPV